MSLFEQPAGNQTYSALTAEEWEALVWAEHLDAVFFTEKDGWIGEPGSDAPIIELDNLNKEPGDGITVPLRKKLTGAGKYGDKTLWDNEEALTFYYLKVFINQLRHASGTAGRMTRQRTAFDSDEQAARALGQWLADKRDGMVFESAYRLIPAHIQASTGTGGLGITARYHVNWYAPDSSTLTGFGSAPANAAAVTGQEDLLADTATQIMGVSLLDDIAAELAVQNILPIIVDGEERYPIVLHPYQTKQLRRDSEWQAAVQAGWKRGRDNPLFKKAIGLWNSLIVYENNRIEAGNNNCRRAIAFGANFMAYARAGEAFTDRETWDYGNQHRYMAGVVNGWNRADFQSDDANATKFNQSSMVISTYSPGL